MKNYCCTKCGSIDVFIDDRGEQKALMCGDCGAWLKWISKKEIPLVKRFIEENNKSFRLSDLIKKIEDAKGIKKCYLYRGYYSGELQLNIEFNNEIADEIIKGSDIKEIDWE